MQETQDAIRTALGNIIDQGGPVEAALLPLVVAAAVFAVGRTNGQSITKWWATGAQTVGLLAGFALLAVQVSRGGWLVDVDHFVTAWLVAHRNPTLDHVALAVTTVLGPIGTTLLTGVFAIAVYLRSRSVACGLIVITTVGGASALCTGIKVLVGRVRPPLGIQETIETDHSFPSGHVTGAAAMFGLIAITLGLTRSRRVRSLPVVTAVVIVSAVAMSRLYLGVHYLTDVAAGALLGAAAVTVGAAALRGFWPDSYPPEHQPAISISEQNALI